MEKKFRGEHESESITCDVITVSSIEAFTSVSAVQSVTTWLTTVSTDISDPSRRAFTELSVFITNAAVLTSTS